MRAPASGSMAWGYSDPQKEPLADVQRPTPLASLHARRPRRHCSVLWFRLRRRHEQHRPRRLRRHPHSELHHAERPQLEQLPGGLALRHVADDAVHLAGQLRPPGPLPAARSPAHRLVRPPPGATTGGSSFSATGPRRYPAVEPWQLGPRGQLPQRCRRCRPGWWDRLELRERRLVARARLAPRSKCAAVHGRAEPSEREPAPAAGQPRHVAHVRRPLRRGPHRQHHPARRRDHGLGRRLRHAGHQPQQHQHGAAGARPRRQLVRAAVDAALGGRLHPGSQHRIHGAPDADPHRRLTRRGDGRSPIAPQHECERPVLQRKRRQRRCSVGALSRGTDRE